VTVCGRGGGPQPSSGAKLPAFSSENRDATRTCFGIVPSANFGFERLVLRPFEDPE
jgi:hypothetical protein